MYSGGASDTPSPTLETVVVAASGPLFVAAALDSPGSSFEGICVRWAREISVGERTGPGLVGGPCLKLPLRVRPCLASG